MVNKKRVSKVLVFVLLIGTLLSSVAFAADVDTTDWVVAEDIKIKTTAHIQKDGDKDFSGNGQIWFGTTGEKKRVEEISIGLEGEVPEDMRIMYMAHVQKDGDTKWTEGPNPAGTHGEAKRIEGIAIKLVDEAGKEYPGYVAEYQVHMAQYGWGINETKNDKNDDNKINDSYKEWASNGTYAGTRGEARRIEAVRLRIRREDELKVKSVSAINAKNLEVTFNTAVDTEKAVFDVKRGSTTVNGLDVEWSEDKKVATLSSDINLVAGDYTVTVTGVSEEALTGTVKVEAQKVSKVEITSQQLVKNTAGTAGTFTYKVVDQYGTDITKSTPQSAFNRSAVIASSTPSVTLDPTTGTGTLTHTFANTDAKAVVTLVHRATGVVATSTLDIAAAATVESVTFGENILPEGKTRIESGVEEAVRVPVTVIDQYGSEIKDTAALSSALNLVSSNQNVDFSFDKDEDGNVFLVMDTSSLSGKATVVLTAVNPTSGKTFTKTFDVVAASAPHSIEVGELSQTTIADGDTDIAIDIKVFDQFGEQLTADQIAKNAVTIAGWVTGDGNDQISAVTVETDKTSKNYGKLVFDTNTDTGYVTLVFNPGNAGATVSTKMFEVKDARVVTSVSKADNVTLLQGATTDLEFVFKDQYGDVIKNSDLSASHTNGDYEYEIKVTRVSGDADGITVNSPTLTGTDEEELAEINVTADTKKTGSYRVTVILTETSTGTEVASASTVVSVKENNVEGIDYEVADIPTLNGTSNEFDEDSVYAQKLKVTAKDANGQEYVINKSDILDVVSSDTSIADTAQNGSDDWYVFGKDIRTIGGNANTDDKTVTLTIKINTLDGIKEVTKEVTVSPKTATVNELKLVSAAITNPTKNISNVTEVSPTFAFDYNLDGELSAESLFVIGKDQYGVWTDQSVTGSNIIVNSTNLAPVDAFSVNTNKLEIASGKGLDITAGKDIKATLQVGKATKVITAKVDTAAEINLTNTDGVIKFTSSYGVDLKGSYNIDISGAAALAVAVADSDDASNGAIKLSLSDAPAAGVTTLTATLDPATDEITIAGTANAAVDQTITVTIEDTITGVSKDVSVKLSAADAGTLTVK